MLDFYNLISQTCIFLLFYSSTLCLHCILTFLSVNLTSHFIFVGQNDYCKYEIASLRMPVVLSSHFNRFCFQHSSLLFSLSFKCIPSAINSFLLYCLLAVHVEPSFLCLNKYRYHTSFTVVVHSIFLYSIFSLHFSFAYILHPTSRPTGFFFAVEAVYLLGYFNSFLRPSWFLGGW